MPKVEGGSIVWDLDADSGKLEKSLNNAKTTVNNTAKEVNSSFSSMAKNIGKSTSDIGKSMSIGLTLPIVGAAGAAIKMATDFDTSMGNIKTLMGDNTEAVGQWEEGIKDLIRTVPKSPEDLGASAYNVISAGFGEASDGLRILEASGRLAVAGLGETEEAVDILTSSLNAFNIPASQANDTSNILFKTVKAGKTTVAELAQSFGATAPIVAAAGFSLMEFQAATAALTTTGMPASQAQNSLRQAVVSLTKPTKEMSALFEKLGHKDLPSYIAAMKEADEGDVLGSLLRDINEQAGGNAEVLTTAFGSVEAYSAALGISTTVSDAYVDTLNDMFNGQDAVNGAFDTQNSTMANQFQLLKNQLNVEMATLGKELFPILKDAIVAASGAIANLITWWQGLSPETQKAIAVFIGLIAVLGPVLTIVGSLITTIGVIGGVIGPAIAFIGSLAGVLGTIASVASTVIAAITPIGWVILAIIGIIALVTAAWKNNWFDIQGKTKSAVDFIVNIWKSFTDFLRFSFATITAVTTIAWNRIMNSIVLPITRAINLVKSIFSTGQNFISSVFMGILSFFLNVGFRIGSAIIKPFQDALNKIKDIANSIKKALDKINPFNRNSPSLVDNVRSGIGIITDEFKSLNKINIEPVVARTTVIGQKVSPDMTKDLSTPGSGGRGDVTVNVGNVNNASDLDSLEREIGFRASLA